MAEADDLSLPLSFAMSAQGKAQTPRSSRPLCLGRMAFNILSILEESNSTSFAEVADRIIATIGAEEVGTQSEQRTLRRRVYDVLNVFCATGLIVKDNKFIQYRPILGTGKQSDVGHQIQARVLLKEATLAEKTKVFLGYKLLIARRREQARPPNAIQLPSIFVAFVDIGNGHVQRAFDGSRLEIIAHSPPRFFSPMGLFEKMGFPPDEQIACLRKMPALAGLEQIVFPAPTVDEKTNADEGLAQWLYKLSL
jgi:hypothetical protein